MTNQNTPNFPISATSSFQPQRPENNGIMFRKYDEHSAKKIDFSDSNQFSNKKPDVKNYEVQPGHYKSPDDSLSHSTVENFATTDSQQKNQYHENNNYENSRGAQVNKVVTQEQLRALELINHENQNKKTELSNEKQLKEFNFGRFHKNEKPIEKTKNTDIENFGARSFQSQKNYQDIAQMIQRNYHQNRNQALPHFGLVREEPSQLVPNGPDESKVYERLPEYELKQPASEFVQVNSPSNNVPKQNPGSTAIGVHPPGPISIKPIPLPVGPDPETCPCVLIESNSNTTQTRATTLAPTPIVTGQLGFIPVIFVPYCPGEKAESENIMKTMFPTATPVPYPCSVCNQHETIVGNNFLDISHLGNIDKIKEALGQANFGFLNVPVSSRVQRRNRKVKRRKSE